MIKEKSEIIEMINVIQEELDRLPEYSIFGESNDESKQESQMWIEELTDAKEGKVPDDVNSEVYLWLNGNGCSALNDFLE